MLEKISYFIRRALRNMRQWPLLCTAAVLTMAVALATVGSFFLVVVNIEQLARDWTQDVQVVAYLQQPIPTQDQAEMKQRIEQIEGIGTARYVSPEAAMDRFKERLEGDAAILEGVAPDILPASFEIGLLPTFRDQQGIEQVIGQVRQHLPVDDLRYGKTWLARFNAFIGMLRFVGLVLGSFLLLAALFIVSNTIKLTLYARRDELEIMALVGATMGFIKVPFLLEGAIQGLAGGILSLIFLHLSFYLLIARGLDAFWLTPLDFELLFLTLPQQMILVAAGALLGVLGSLSSLRRFVRI